MGLFGPPNVEKMKAKRDVKGLIKALGFQLDPAIRQSAAGVLGDIGGPQAVEPLIAALKDRDKDVRQAAAEAMDGLGWQPDRGEVGATYWVAKRQCDRCVEIGAPAVEPLIVALKDTYVRKAAALALGQIGDARAVEPLIVALKDMDSDVRQAAARALGQIGDARAVEPLITALRDKDQDVRSGAAHALGQIGDPRVVEPLITALRDKDQDVRRAAAWAMVKIGAPAVEPLIAALKDKGWSVRQDAAGVLDKLGWKPDKGEIGAAYWIAKQEWDKCVEIGAPAVEPLIAALKDANSDVRQAAARSLVKLGWKPDRNEAGAAYWATKLKDRDMNVRKAAVKAMEGIGDARAVEPLIAVLKDANSDVRQAAAEALVRMYASGRLDDAHKRSILAQRSTIMQPHHDGYSHYDKYECGEHKDEKRHDDTGIGVAFPL